MAKISKYAADSTIAAGDKLLGTDATTGNTKSYTLSDIGSFIDTTYDTDTTYTAGTGLDLSTTTFSVDVSDFLTNGVNNRVITATGTDAMNSEANLTFDGSTLAVTGDLTVGVDDTGHDVKFFGATAGRYLLWDETNDALVLTDNTKLKIGTSEDLKIYHDGSHSYIDSAGTGILNVRSTTDDVSISAPSSKGVYLYVGGQNGIRTFHGGGSELYYANTKRIETTSAGGTVTGALIVTTDADITGSALVTQNLRRTVTAVSGSSDSGVTTHTCVLTANDNFGITAANEANELEFTVATENIGQSGIVIITNPGTVDSLSWIGLAVKFKTPSGATINHVVTTAAVSILSYYILATDKILINYVGDFS